MYAATPKNALRLRHDLSLGLAVGLAGGEAAQVFSLWERCEPALWAALWEKAGRPRCFFVCPAPMAGRLRRPPVEPLEGPWPSPAQEAAVGEEALWAAAAEGTAGGPQAAAQNPFATALFLAEGTGARGILVGFELAAGRLKPLAKAFDMAVMEGGLPQAALLGDDLFDSRQIAEVTIPTAYHPQTRLVGFLDQDGSRVHTALVFGLPNPEGDVAVRLHSSCLTGDVFHSHRCDCFDQLQKSLQAFSRKGGVLLYLNQEGRNIGLLNKIKAYRLQSCGVDTYAANDLLGLPADGRRYDIAARMLRHLGIRKITLLSNNEDKRRALESTGLAVGALHPLLGELNDDNARYLKEKQILGGHLLETLFTVKEPRS